MRSFRSLIERQIAKARVAGGLTGLKGEGAPLPDRPVETGEQAAVSTAMRIMAEAGVVPEEFTLKTRLDAARKAYADAPDADTRKAAMAELADLEMRYEIAREARRKFMS
ncbi:DnaJ family domain-containing protein [uncultured Roseobacter sp.]|uniref:DnaJ family domain-containing protein n=1 Tax=uncultured Roseobacter sp. TaxID=114847 RepID=UPI002613CBD9|nr:DnaJ family domain-containing protein [uncultured Roseobacter sp.]